MTPAVLPRQVTTERWPLEKGPPLVFGRLGEETGFGSVHGFCARGSCVNSRTSRYYNVVSSTSERPAAAVA